MPQGWTPVDDPTSLWMPVDETPAPKKGITDALNPLAPMGAGLDVIRQMAGPIGEWGSHVAAARQDAELRDAAAGNPHPLKAAIEAFAPNIIADTARSVQELLTPTNVALGMAGAAMAPVRAGLGLYGIAAGGGEGAASPYTAVYKGLKQGILGTDEGVTPEQVREEAMKGAMFYGGLAGTAEAGPKTVLPITNAVKGITNRLTPTPSENITTVQRLMNSYAKVPKAAFDFDINPGEEAGRAVVAGKVKAATKAEAVKAFRTHTDEIGKQIGEIVRSADQTADIPIREAIDPTVHNKLSNAISKSPIEHVKDWLDEHFPQDKMSPKELWEGIKKIDQQTKFTEGTQDELTRNALLQEVRSNLRRQLEDRLPDVKGVSRSYAGLTHYTDALDRSWRGEQAAPLPSRSLLAGEEIIGKTGLVAKLGRKLVPMDRLLRAQDTTPKIFKMVRKYGKVIPAVPPAKVTPWQRSMPLEGTSLTGPLFEPPSAAPKYPYLRRGLSGLLKSGATTLPEIPSSVKGIPAEYGTAVPRPGQLQLPEKSTVPTRIPMGPPAGIDWEGNVGHDPETGMPFNTYPELRKLFDRSRRSP